MIEHKFEAQVAASVEPVAIRQEDEGMKPGLSRDPARLSVLPISHRMTCRTDHFERPRHALAIARPKAPRRFGIFRHEALAQFARRQVAHRGTYFRVDRRDRGYAVQQCAHVEAGPAAQNRYGV